MDTPNCNTTHQKGQHLTSEERHEIEVRLKDGWTIYKIAKHLSRPYNTIKNEVERGTVLMYRGKIKRYKADEGKKVYLEHRQNSRKNYKCLETADFLKYTVEHFKTDGWSLDSCTGKAIESGKFPRSRTVCTKTLYNYVDMDFLPIKNIDLPEKLKRNTKTHRVRENKKKLGKSIEERPEIIALREEFGHWEIDSVLGKKEGTESAIMTVVERKTRKAIWLKVRDHSADAINEALTGLFENFGDKYTAVFKSITGDNGSEFARLSEFEAKGISVYFTHPYSSYEKGTNECHNRMLRRFIPKGRKISDYSADDIMFFADAINGLPRKILNYSTPDEMFDRELDRIYAA